MQALLTGEIAHRDTTSPQLDANKLNGMACVTQVTCANHSVLKNLRFPGERKWGECQLTRVKIAPACGWGKVNAGASVGAASALPPDVRRWLCPAVEVPSISLGYALGAASGPVKSEGLNPDQGHSPELIYLLSAGQSHRLTSGGKPNFIPAVRTACSDVLYFAARLIAFQIKGRVPQVWPRC